LTGFKYSDLLTETKYNNIPVICLCSGLTVTFQLHVLLMVVLLITDLKKKHLRCVSSFGFVSWTIHKWSALQSHYL